MSISMRDKQNPELFFPVSYPDFLDLRDSSRAFKVLGAFRSDGFVVRSEGGEAAHLQGARVTSDILPLSGVAPIIGAPFAGTKRSRVTTLR
jgi:hypothetical protein